jgi:hypothetical protein
MKQIVVGAALEVQHRDILFWSVANIEELPEPMASRSGLLAEIAR